MSKAIYVATVVQTHIMEFHIPYLKMLKEMGWDTAVASRNDYVNQEECVIPYCDNFFDVPFERNPFSSKNIKAYKQLKKIINEGQYDIIHCHTPIGAAITRLAATDARKKGAKVVYTAHGFHFFKGSPLINWIVYYPVEKILARKTDVLITINKEDYQLALRKLKARRVEYVPGVGIDADKFVCLSKTRETKREELGLASDDFVILSVGELRELKNHEVVLRALSELKKRNKIDNIHYLICGRGVHADFLQNLTISLGISDHVSFLGYRNDISEICNCADAFVFMSYREGLPVALMEAMASGLPVICSKIRGNVDLIQDRENGLFAENDPTDVANSILLYYSDPDLRYRCAKKALEDSKKYDINSIRDVIKRIYLEK